MAKTATKIEDHEESNKPLRKALHAAESAPAEAREQATEYGSAYASWPLELDNGDVMMIPPHPQYQMLDDDRMEAYEELIYEADTTYERGPDIVIPEQRLKDGNGKENGIVVPGETVRGALLQPYRKKNEAGIIERVKPVHSVKVVQVCLGDVEYKRLREGGKSAADVWKVWADQSEVINARTSRDSKSKSSTVGLAAVPETDSE